VLSALDVRTDRAGLPEWVLVGIEWVLRGVLVAGSQTVLRRFGAHRDTCQGFVVRELERRVQRLVYVLAKSHLGALCSPLSILALCSARHFDKYEAWARFHHCK
jgi:hypothetical protein